MALEKYITRLIKATGLSKKEIWKMINYKKTRSIINVNFNIESIYNLKVHYFSFLIKTLYTVQIIIRKSYNDMKPSC